MAPKPMALAGLVVLTTLVYGGWAAAQSQLDVTIDSGPSGTTTATDATFTFSARGGEPPVSFTCTLDGVAESCTSPKSYSGLAVGGHTFAVEGVDARGNRDQARSQWEIEEPPDEPPPPPDEPPPPPDEPPPLEQRDGALVGPSEVPFGEPASYSVEPIREIARYEWDLDGSGRFATDTGPFPHVHVDFAKPGATTIRVRATGADGSFESAKQVTVLRPTLAALEFRPAVPRPGESVKLRVVSRSETGFEPVYYAWTIAGLKPLTRTLSRSRLKSSARAAAAPGSYSIKLSNAQPTAKPTLTRSFAEPGVHRVEAALVGANGRQTTVSADIKVVAARGLDDFIGPRSEATRGARACKQIRFGGCAAIAVETNPGPVKAPIVFTNASPELEICIKIPSVAGGATTVGSVKLAKVFAAKDLPYPPPDQFFADSAWNEQILGPPAKQGQQEQQQAGAGRARATQLKVVKKTVCRYIASQTVSWDFGDGNVLPQPDQPAQPLTVVPHSYQKAGKYTVTLVARRFYLVKEELGKPGTEEYNQNLVGIANEDPEELLETGLIQPYRVKTSIEMEVFDKFCGVLQLNGVAARAFTVPGSYVVQPLSPSSQDSCFLAFVPEGGDHKVYRPIPGDHLSLNGMLVEPSPGGVVIVDPKTARVSTLDGSDLHLSFFSEEFAVPDAGTTPQIVVPKPKLDPELNQTVAALPDYGATVTGKLAGFDLNGVRFFLSPNSTALARLSLAPREPLNGATPLVVVGGSTAQTASHVAPDFALDLNDINIGPFTTKEFTLKHYPGGEGWQGGGMFSLDLGGTSYDLNAKYLPDSGDTADRCADLGVDAGPSGLAMPDSGPFKFAGGSVSGFSIVVGPAEIYCFGASFKQKPFTLVGLIGAHIPPGTNFVGVDVCVLVAVLAGGEQTGGCNTSYKAVNGDEVWVAGRGKVTLLDALTLGTAGFDIHAGADILKTSAFGEVSFEAGPFYIKGKVAGLIRIKPPPAGFEFTGEIELGIGGCPVCVDVKGIVSSKGIGACADVFVLSGGFVYKWGGSLNLFGGCSWGKFSSIRVSSSSLASPVGASQAGVPVRGEPGGIAFQVEGQGAAPRVALVTPDGKRIAPSPRDTRPYQRVDGVGFLRLEASGESHGKPFVAATPPQTIITVPKSEAGTYRIEKELGSVAITRVRTAERLPPRRILAKVVGSGANRRLEYLVRPIPGQSVRFVEEGGTVGRAIGNVPASSRDGTGSLDFPAGYGAGGRRVVSAIISQGGVPIRKLPVTTYVAPRPPAVPAPSSVKVSRKGGDDLKACWTGVPAAQLYEVTVVSTDGRTLLRRTSAQCASFPGFDRSVGARVSVRAKTPWGSSRERGRSRLSRMPRSPSRLTL